MGCGALRARLIWVVFLEHWGLNIGGFGRNLVRLELRSWLKNDEAFTLIAPSIGKLLGVKLPNKTLGEPGTT